MLVQMSAFRPPAPGRNAPTGDSGEQQPQQQQQQQQVARQLAELLTQCRIVPAASSPTGYCLVLVVSIVCVCGGMWEGNFREFRFSRQRNLSF